MLNVDLTNENSIHLQISREEGEMEGETIVISSDKIEIVDTLGYKEELSEHFNQVPEVAKPLLKEAKTAFSKIEKALYTAPAFINAVKASIPNVTLQAVLTDEQKHQLANGVLKLMTKKDGSLMANLINPETKKIVTTIPLKSVQMAPEMTRAMINFSTQMQMVQIAEQIQAVQVSVEEVRMGQEYDRLAMAYSCQQKLIQAMEIKNPELKAMALMQLASSAEDSRNLLMLSQKTNVEFITSQPENFFQKIMAGVSTEKINGRMSEIRESLCAVNMVSFVEAMAYQELREHEAAKKSLKYYAEFIEETYISTPGLLQRLDMIDPATENYWSKKLPCISEKIKALPVATDRKLLETKTSQRKKK